MSFFFHVFQSEFICIDSILICINSIVICINLTLINDILTILLNDLLPSFGKLKNSMFEKVLIFRSEKLVKPNFYSLIRIECFTIQMVLKAA